MGPESIQLYLKFLKTGTERKKDIRVIIVGKKGSGKTTLTRRLLKEDKNIVESTNGTEVHIKNCSVRTADGEWMTNRVKKVHHLSHKECIIESASSSPEPDDTIQGTFQFWFNSVHCFCDPSDEDDEGFVLPPVIVVGTHTDQYGNIRDSKSIMTMHLDKMPSKVRKHIRETELLSNTQDTDDKLNSLREKIMKTAEHSKSWNVELPVKFILLEQKLQRLRELGKPILSFDEIESIAKETLEPILERDQLKLFLRYQHEIGSLVYYNDITECIVLDTKWLADVFKCIVTAEKYQLDLPRFEWSEVCNTGRLDKKLLVAIFAKQSKNIQENKDYLVKLMEKFYVLVRPRTLSETNTIEQNSEYYVPCLVKTMASKDVDERFQIPAIKSKSLCFALHLTFCLQCYLTIFLLPAVANKASAQRH